MAYDKEKRRISSAKWHAANPARTKQLSVDYYANNREEILRRGAVYREKKPELSREMVRAWKENNKERALQVVRDWRKNNRSKCSASSRKYEAKKLMAIPKWANQEAINEIYDRAAINGCHVDHIVPLQSSLVCGLHVESNLAILSPLENMRKGNRVWPDMPSEVKPTQ